MTLDLNTQVNQNPIPCPSFPLLKYPDYKSSMSDRSGPHGQQLNRLQPIRSVPAYYLTTVTICLAYAHYSQCSVTD